MKSFGVFLYFEIEVWYTFARNKKMRFEMRCAAKRKADEITFLHLFYLIGGTADGV